MALGTMYGGAVCLRVAVTTENYFVNRYDIRDTRSGCGCGEDSCVYAEAQGEQVRVTLRDFDVVDAPKKKNAN